MNKVWIITTLFLVVLSNNLLAQETSTNQTVTNESISTNTRKTTEEAKNFSINLNLSELIISPLILHMTSIYTTTEFSITKYLALQLNIGYLGESRSRWGIQFGGGIRYYPANKGLTDYWIGCYADYFIGSWGGGEEIGLITGYKFNLGLFSIEPFIGGRIILLDPERTFSPVTYGPRLGLNIGLCF